MRTLSNLAVSFLYKLKLTRIFTCIKYQGMAFSAKMVPGVIVWLVLLNTCFGAKSDVQCPGNCVDENSCSMTLNETNCDNGLVCCVDHLQSVQTTEFTGWDFTTEHSDIPEVEVEEESQTLESEGYHYVEPEESEEGFTYVYSDESDVVMMDEAEERSGDLSEGCPGTCVASNDVENCDYIYTADVSCQAGYACCMMESDVERTSDRFNYEIDGSHSVGRRAVEHEAFSQMACPGSCVHPSHAMFCEEILPQFSCPLNAKCCIKRSIDRVMSVSSVVECTGQCLPMNMQGYCFPPNELMMGLTSCARGTTCCMRRPADSIVRPPSVQIPGLPSRDPTHDASRMVLGHLAIDDMGTVFKVGTNGQISRLPHLSHTDHMRAKYTQLASYPRADGEITIYSDSLGVLYQQFLPRQQTSGLPRVTPQAESVETNIPEQSEEANDDIVIPDDDDEAPVPTTSAPVVHDDKASRPQCPGSCMSYFLRFTCFRGYAIYDGFTCPGRSVCCARMKDIEDHERYLKSLSPYFNVPSPSREGSLQRCGIKGRRDAPRVIGGKESLPGEWCWQVAIINVQNQYICGGALIDNSWVLTAAHCVVGSMNENQALFVRVGVTDLKSSEDNSKGQTVRVLSSFIHHNFHNANLDNNVALLRLQKPVELGPSVCVICLPTRGQMPKENTRCTVTGYGFVSKDGGMSLKIREAQVPIVDDMDCMTNVTEALTNPFILPASSFCAGGHGQQDACQGDAGGPLACEVGGYYELVGIVSWGLGCGRSDVPSIYIKVPAFMGWINQIISSNSFLTSLT